MRIVFATAEVSPIAKTGGLGDVCGSLPKELARLGHDVTVFMPFYRQAKLYFASERIEPELLLPSSRISWADWVADVAFYSTTLPGSDVPVILVASDFFFDRERIYSGVGGVDDSLLRFTVFCRAVIAGCERLGIAPDILHCHDWHTALLPLYLHSGLRGSREFRATRSVYTIHNLNYQGIAPAAAFASTGLHSRYWAPDALEHFGQLNAMKGGILFADQVTTVSPNYASEIMTPEHGTGLDGVLRAVSGRFSGILNGIDIEEWNPATDPLLPSNFDSRKLGGKTATKQALVREAGLAQNAGAALLGVVSRMVDQKGFQLLLPILGGLLEAGAQAVILGSGDVVYEQGFQRVAARYPENCKVWIGFDNALAHRIYGGCDMLLMPSIYEPCGLNQMYSLRYGTLPVVRLTGGLADTVIPFDGTNEGTATGFGFVAPSQEQLYGATRTGMLNFQNPSIWKRLQGNAMKEDFSWTRSARRYEEAYRRAANG